MALPRLTERTVSKCEHVAFNTYRQMMDLHTHFLSKDKLQAEFQLVNDETRDSVVSRTDFVDVDLTAYGVPQSTTRN